MRDNGNPTYRQLVNILKERDEAKYPKGHIIPTTNSSFNPNGIYPGVWEKLPDGTILMAGKSDNSSKDNKFTISEKQMPKHSHGGNTLNPDAWMNFLPYDEGYASHSIIYNQNGFTVYDAGEQVKNIKINASISGYHGYGAKADFSGKWSGSTEEKGNSESIDLSTILKHPITYLWIRIS